FSFQALTLSNFLLVRFSTNRVFGEVSNSPGGSPRHPGKPPHVDHDRQETAPPPRTAQAARTPTMKVADRSTPCVLLICLCCLESKQKGIARLAPHVIDLYPGPRCVDLTTRRRALPEGARCAELSMDRQGLARTRPPWLV